MQLTTFHKIISFCCYCCACCITVLSVVVDFSYRKFIAIVVGFVVLTVRPLPSLCSGSKSSCWQVFMLLLATDRPLKSVILFQCIQKGSISFLGYKVNGVQIQPRWVETSFNSCVKVNVQSLIIFVSVDGHWQHVYPALSFFLFSH